MTDITAVTSMVCNIKTSLHNAETYVWCHPILYATEQLWLSALPAGHVAANITAEQMVVWSQVASLPQVAN